MPAEVHIHESDHRNQIAIDDATESVTGRVSLLRTPTQVNKYGFESTN